MKRNDIRNRSKLTVSFSISSEGFKSKVPDNVMKFIVAVLAGLTVALITSFWK